MKWMDRLRVMDFERVPVRWPVVDQGGHRGSSGKGSGTWNFVKSRHS